MSVAIQADELLEAEKKRLSCYEKRLSAYSHDSVPVLKKRISAAGVTLVGYQCSTCGCWKGVKSSLVNKAIALPDFDDTIYRAFYERISAQEKEKLEREHAQYQADKNAKYSAYLRTEKWRVKRALALKRDNGICQSCLVSPATQVHHKTYDHIYDEPLFDLESICIPCHERITEMDRARYARPATEIATDLVTCSSSVSK